MKTKYYFLSPTQQIWLRKGSKWKPMLIKIFASMAILVGLSFLPSEEGDQNAQKRWVMTLGGLFLLYFLITSSLYIF